MLLCELHHVEYRVRDWASQTHRRPIRRGITPAARRKLEGKAWRQIRNRDAGRCKFRAICRRSRRRRGMFSYSTIFETTCSDQQMPGEPEEDAQGDGSAPSQSSPTNKPKRKRGRGGCYTCRRRKVSLLLLLSRTRKLMSRNCATTFDRRVAHGEYSRQSQLFIWQLIGSQRLEIPCVFPKLYRNKDGTLAPSPQPNGRGRRLRMWPPSLPYTQRTDCQPR